MCQGVLSPNLTRKFQWEVSQIANNRFPLVMLLGGLSVNLNHLKIMELPCTTKDFPVELSCVISGMRPANDENLSERCDDLIGLGLKNVKCKKATRAGNRDGKPGIIKVEFDNLTDKISVL